jgi:hypothetical protein
MITKLGPRGRDRDHGGLADGAWRNKSEDPDPADQAARLVIEWTTDLMTTGPAPQPTQA